MLKPTLHKPDASSQLIVGISSRTLFDLSESHHLFEQEGLTAYHDYQVERENEILAPGPAFNLIKKLLSLHHPETEQPLVEVILLSRNSADTGLRIFNSIAYHNLNITRAAFTNGMSPYRYVTAYQSHLFLSANDEDVRDALQAGCAAATLLANPQVTNDEHPELRIAFDGDAVLFSDEAEKIYQQSGLDAFQASEKAAAHKPLAGGPFHGFIRSLHSIQSVFPADSCPIRTALITARNAPAHERVIRTLRNWQIRIDEALFLGGLAKGEFLKAFSADIFFDDQKQHCQTAGEHVTAGHVPHGIVNESK